MQTLEITGKTVEEATQNAAKQLGADASQLKVTVIEQSKGLFGKSTVRIRAEVEGSAVAVEEPAPTPEAPAPEPEPEPAPAVEAAAETEAEAEPQEGAASEEPPKVATQEDADNICALVRGILDSGELDVSAQVTGINGRYVNIELDGRDAAFLVGKHGEVLNALQYLVNIIANQRLQSGIRATIDGNNYRHKREEDLTQMAQKIADQVKKRGEEAVLDALPAFERRIVHKALSEISGVTTYSEGEEPNRRVVIAPAD